MQIYGRSGPSHIMFSIFVLTGLFGMVKSHNCANNGTIITVHYASSGTSGFITCKSGIEGNEQTVNISVSQETGRVSNVTRNGTTASASFVIGNITGNAAVDCTVTSGDNCTVTGTRTIWRRDRFTASYALFILYMLLSIKACIVIIYICLAVSAISAVSFTIIIFCNRTEVFKPDKYMRIPFDVEFVDKSPRSDGTSDANHEFYYASL